MQTCRFGVRPYANGGSPISFEVFDRMTGAAVGGGMRRAEAEDQARGRNHDTSGPSTVTLYLRPAELDALRAAVDAYLAWAADRHSRILEELYELFSGGERNPG